MSRHQSRGFSLIELLITLVVIGVIAAISLPNLMAAIDKGKQKRTMADLRSIGTAVEAYAVDNSKYPVASDASTLALTISGSSSFVKVMPQLDGWDHPFVVDSEATAYTISSSGKDGAPSGCVIGTLTTRFDPDICFSHGQYIQYPVGPQD
jgi:general secretion pathway protein G